MQDLNLPPLTTALNLILLLFVASQLLSAVHNFFFHPLSRIPGPPLASISTLPSQIRFFQRIRFLWVHACHQTYGPIVRTAPGIVEIGSADYLDEVYGKRLDKPPGTVAFDSGEGDGRSSHIFSCLTTAEAQGKRRGMLPHFAVTNIMVWEPTIHEHMREVLEVLEEAKTKPVDVMTLTTHLLIDILGELLLDIHPGGVKSIAAGAPLDIATAINLWPGRGTLKTMMPSLAWKILSRVPVASWQLRVTADKVMQAYVSPIVKATRQKMKDGGSAPERPCLIHRISVATDAYTGALWTEKAVIAECVNSFLAGTDTTAAATTFILYRLSQRPDVMQKLQAELDAAMTYPEEILGLQVLTGLPYLNAVIKEVGGSLFRSVKPGGMVAYGHFIPEGTLVGIQAYTVHRDPTIWGYDFAEFRPERWLNETPEMKAAHLPFSTGSRSCPGRILAWFDLRLIVSSIASKFDVRASDETTPESMEPRDLNTTLPRDGRCLLHFTQREVRG